MKRRSKLIKYIIIIINYWWLKVKLINDHNRKWIIIKRIVR